MWAAASQRQQGGGSCRLPEGSSGRWAGRVFAGHLAVLVFAGAGQWFLSLGCGERWQSNTSKQEGRDFARLCLCTLPRPVALPLRRSLWSALQARLTLWPERLKKVQLFHYFYLLLVTVTGWHAEVLTNHWSEALISLKVRTPDKILQVKKVFFLVS